MSEHDTKASGELTMASSIGIGTAGAIVSVASPTLGVLGGIAALAVGYWRNSEALRSFGAGMATSGAVQLAWNGMSPAPQASSPGASGPTRTVSNTIPEAQYYAAVRQAARVSGAMLDAVAIARPAEYIQVTSGAGTTYPTVAEFVAQNREKIQQAWNDGVASRTNNVAGPTPDTSTPTPTRTPGEAPGPVIQITETTQPQPQPLPGLRDLAQQQSQRQGSSSIPTLGARVQPVGPVQMATNIGGVSAATVQPRLAAGPQTIQGTFTGSGQLEARTEQRAEFIPAPVATPWTAQTQQKQAANMPFKRNIRTFRK